MVLPDKKFDTYLAVLYPATSLNNAIFLTMALTRDDLERRLNNQTGEIKRSEHPTDEAYRRLNTQIFFQGYQSFLQTKFPADAKTRKLEEEAFYDFFTALASEGVPAETAICAAVVAERSRDAKSDHIDIRPIKQSVDKITSVWGIDIHAALQFATIEYLMDVYQLGQIDWYLIIKCLLALGADPNHPNTSFHAQLKDELLLDKAELDTAFLLVLFHYMCDYKKIDLVADFLEQQKRLQTQIQLTPTHITSLIENFAQVNLLDWLCDSFPEELKSFVAQNTEKVVAILDKHNRYEGIDYLRQRYPDIDFFPALVKIENEIVAEFLAKHYRARLSEHIQKNHDIFIRLFNLETLASEGKFERIDDLRKKFGINPFRVLMQAQLDYNKKPWIGPLYFYLKNNFPNELKECLHFNVEGLATRFVNTDDGAAIQSLCDHPQIIKLVFANIYNRYQNEELLHVGIRPNVFALQVFQGLQQCMYDKIYDYCQDSKNNDQIFKVFFPKAIQQSADVYNVDWLRDSHLVLSEKLDAYYKRRAKCILDFIFLHDYQIANDCCFFSGGKNVSYAGKTLRVSSDLALLVSNLKDVIKTGWMTDNTFRGIVYNRDIHAIGKRRKWPIGTDKTEKEIFAALNTKLSDSSPLSTYVREQSKPIEGPAKDKKSDFKFIHASVQVFKSKGDFKSVDAPVTHPKLTTGKELKSFTIPATDLRSLKNIHAQQLGAIKRAASFAKTPAVDDAILHLMIRTYFKGYCLLLASDKSEEKYYLKFFNRHCKDAPAEAMVCAAVHYDISAERKYDHIEPTLHAYGTNIHKTLQFAVLEYLNNVNKIAHVDWLKVIRKLLALGADPNYQSTTLGTLVPKEQFVRTTLTSAYEFVVYQKNMSERAIELLNLFRSQQLILGSKLVLSKTDFSLIFPKLETLTTPLVVLPLFTWLEKYPELMKDYVKENIKSILTMLIKNEDFDSIMILTERNEIDVYPLLEEMVLQINPARPLLHFLEQRFPPQFSEFIQYNSTVGTVYHYDNPHIEFIYKFVDQNNVDILQKWNPRPDSYATAIVLRLIQNNQNFYESKAFKWLEGSNPAALKRCFNNLDQGFTISLIILPSSNNLIYLSNFLNVDWCFFAGKELTPHDHKELSTYYKRRAHFILDFIFKQAFPVEPTSVQVDYDKKFIKVSTHLAEVIKLLKQAVESPDKAAAQFVNLYVSCVIYKKEHESLNPTEKDIFEALNSGLDDDLPLSRYVQKEFETYLYCVPFLQGCKEAKECKESESFLRTLVNDRLYDPRVTPLIFQFLQGNKTVPEAKEDLKDAEEPEIKADGPTWHS